MGGVKIKCGGSADRERKAFFPRLLTAHGVALELWYGAIGSRG